MSKAKMYCPCVPCRVENFLSEYEKLRYIALRVGNRPIESEMSIGAAISECKHVPESIGQSAVDLLDRFSHLLRRG